MKKSTRWAVSVLILVAAVTMRWFESGAPLDDALPAGKDSAGAQLPAGKLLSGRVTRVVDGDSLYLSTYDKQIRLWAVDAPERNESGYKEATNTLVKFAKNKTLNCELKDTDKYGRYVARCEDERGKDINQMMLKSGTTEEYCRFSNNFYGFC